MFVAMESLFRISNAYSRIRTKQAKLPNYEHGWKQFGFDWTGATDSIEAFDRIPSVVWDRLASRAKRAHVAKFAELPTDIPGAEAARVTDPVTGISVRVIAQYDVRTDVHRWCVDVAGYPKHANR